MARPPIEVIVLGTSSAAPTVRRGLSATTLIREGETILFDCGEGTQFRMLEAEIPRRKFHHIFISHLHGDHVFGLPGLISSLNLGQREYPLHLWGPRPLKKYIDFVTNWPRPTRIGFDIEVHEFAPGHEGLICEAPEWTVTSLPLDHTIPAMGYRFEEKELPGVFDGAKADALGVPFGPERKRLLRGESITLDDGAVIDPEALVGATRRGRAIAYCTDTAFCENAIRLTRDADLLLHESTYGDEFEEMAKDRKHSTIRQAATVAKEAGARHFVATHFSTRYEFPKLFRAMEKEGREVFPDLQMAHDLMRIEVYDREE
ncbi:MAG: ribonuclease Z [Planctomycetes bacterium]|nr:ribonuclease Z [Planctomycetota bacterium]